MKLPSLSSLGLLFGSLLLPTIIEAQRPGYPTIDVSPAAEANWTALVDLSKAPKVPVRTAGACPTGDPYCTWSCTQCTKPDTDIVKCPKANDWGITYDDGPSPYTPVILDYLKAKGVKATFFVIGSRVTNNPDILKRTVAEGHQIGIHTWSHTPLTTQTSEVVIAELKWTEKIIKEVTGLTPKFMRPPQGDYDDRIRYISKSLGYKIVVWDDDTFDWKSNTDSTFDLSWITGNFTQWVKDKSTGHISLEHDLYQKTAGMAPKAIDIVMGAGFSIKDVATCTGLVPYLESNATTSNSTLSTPTGTNAVASSTNIPAGKSIATKNNNNNFLLGIVSAIVFSIIFSSF